MKISLNKIIILRKMLNDDDVTKENSLESVKSK